MCNSINIFFYRYIIQKTKSNFKLSDFLIYVFLQLVCDVMPLRKINKILAHNVINNFKLKII